ncbi:MAG TPA: hypothetical protein VGH74_06830 [Planctomycetaceae bacterium]|jgi:uncharacterized BrkB/YihY/UPF0761 family membrane protein
MVLQGAWQIIKEAGLKWVNDNAQRLGAALAFFSVLSLGPAPAAT